MQLRSFTCWFGVKISYRPPGQASNDLLKEGIVLYIVEKQLINKLVAASEDQPTDTTAISTQVPSVVTIHKNFHLVNVMFCEEITQISHQCGSATTRNELDTNMDGSHSPFLE
jgi:hypothetical protein